MSTETWEVDADRLDNEEADPYHAVAPMTGKEIMTAWLNNLASPWREVYKTIKARDPKGARRN